MSSLVMKTIAIATIISVVGITVVKHKDIYDWMRDKRRKKIPTGGSVPPPTRGTNTRTEASPSSDTYSNNVEAKEMKRQPVTSSICTWISIYGSYSLI